ncbi:MAG: UDP-N-acetylmuramoyl-tripeptide--D-alanyl-D-alanine ligase [Kiritimatiellae bacterium]|nr:UDP-N-acetylmuramoyl-tripeptide--D-alanyl-D-alanine ligase [Kiritimatiellia bacterium]
MLTSSMLARWCGGRWTRPAPPVRRVVHDSREVEPGDLFVAIRGDRFDGHDFVADAAGRGAVGAVVERGAAARLNMSLPLLVVEDSRRALAEMAARHRARWRGRVIGITGSVGKTTTKELLADVLATQGRTARTPGNRNNDIGLPLALLNAPPDLRWGVFEVGISHPGEMEPLAAMLQPDWVVFTRIGPAHIEFFGSEAAIAREKAQLAANLPPRGTVIAAADEPWLEVIRSATRARIVTVALEAPADFVGRVESTAEGPWLEVRGGAGFVLRCRLPVRGEPFARAALRAAAVAALAGADPEAAAVAIAEFRPLPMRGEEQIVGGVRWINDAYNANPLSVRAAVETFAADRAPRKWLVLGGMHELGATAAEAHRQVGREVARGEWAGVITVGDLAAGIAEGAAESGRPALRLYRCANVEEAAQCLAELLRPGDAVLLKGSRAEHVDRVVEEWARRRRAGALDG